MGCQLQLELPGQTSPGSTRFRKDPQHRVETTVHRGGVIDLALRRVQFNGGDFIDEQAQTLTLALELQEPTPWASGRTWVA